MRARVWQALSYLSFFPFDISLVDISPFSVWLEKVPKKVSANRDQWSDGRIAIPLHTLFTLTIHFSTLGHLGTMDQDEDDAQSFFECKSKRWRILAWSCSLHQGDSDNRSECCCWIKRLIGYIPDDAELKNLTEDAGKSEGEFVCFKIELVVSICADFFYGCGMNWLWRQLHLAPFHTSTWWKDPIGVDNHEVRENRQYNLFVIFIGWAIYGGSL